MKTALGKKEEMTRDHKGFFARRDELSSKMNLLDKESYRLQGQKEKLEEEQESQTSYMWEEYEMTYGQAKEQADQEPGERGRDQKADPADQNRDPPAGKCKCKCDRRI